MMDSLDLLRRLHDHRVWANSRLMETAKTLNSHQLHEQHAIGQGTIWKSLLHMYGAEYVWLEALLGNAEATLPGDQPGELPGNQAGDASISGLGDLDEQWRVLTARWRSYLETLGKTNLEEIVYKVSTSSGRGQEFGTSRADVLLHVCTHAQYTAAQVVNMYRHSGVQMLPDVMLISLARGQQ